MMVKLDVAATLFIGVSIGLSIAAFGYGATGLKWPDSIAFFGFLITSGLHAWLKANADAGAKN